MNRVRNAWAVLNGRLDADYERVRQEQVHMGTGYQILAKRVAILERLVAELRQPKPTS